jgi:hypothetical protein
MASDASPDFRKASMSSMIVELENILSSQHRNIVEVDVPKHTLPRARYEMGKAISLYEGEIARKNPRFPCIHSTELGPDDFHSENVQP